jgi:hypothetical protein
METPEWLREVRDEFEGYGAWVSTLNILDNEEEEFDCETDADVAAHVLLNLAELADESQAAAHRVERACVTHLSRTVAVRLAEAAAAQGRRDGGDAEVEALRTWLELAVETMSLDQWREFMEQDDVKRLPAQ